MSLKIDIRHYLPHRSPMLMVDWIIAMDSQMVETTFEIKEDNIFVSDEIFSEAGLIENAAQTCSAIVGKGYYEDENAQEKEDADVIGFISAIKTLKIIAMPEIGQTIFTKATLVSQFVGDDYTLCTMSCETFADGKPLLEGEINLFIRENPAAKTASAKL